MTEYNMSFLISGLIILLLILYHFTEQRKLESDSNRIFQFFIIVGISDIFCDLTSSLLIMEADRRFSALTMGLLTMLYLLQALLPYALFCYTQSLRSCRRNIMRRTMALWSVPCAFLAVLIISNCWNGLLFFFDSAGRYTKGPLYMIMYYVALGYVIVIALSSARYYKELGREKFKVIWEFIFIVGICVAVQACQGELLTTGFGIGLGITVLFLTINNPYSYMDNLTGAFDKQYFSRWMQEKLNEGKQMNVISVDMHHLKRINKIFGNSTGDKLLIRVAEELQEISGSAHVFRITGKRFLLLTYSLAEYERSRDRIQKFFEQDFVVDGEQIRFPAVVCGILEAEKFEESDTLLSYIEYLVSLASDSEDGRLIQGDEKTMQGFWYEQEIERFLNTAIEQDLFEVYYQPVYPVCGTDFITLEALSRLRHPALGNVSPEVFIGIAEKNGQITRIGYLQFRRVCCFIKEHEELMTRIRNVKFNLSPSELLKHGYIRKLIDVICEYELPFSYFQFEITETVATEYCENLYQAVSDFLDAGIGLCLDDFGSGYANLNTILKLPFSSIKLDRSLLNGICEDSQIASFYQSIVSVLQGLGYDVIAEGVETEDEMRLLQDWGINMIQGYYFSRPVSGEEIVKKILE